MKPSEKYLSKALQMLIQDLAEYWNVNDVGNPRDVNELHDSECQKIAEKVVEITHQQISSRTVRDFKNEKTIGQTSTRDIVAAAWFVITNRAKKEKVQPPTGTTKDYWDGYMNLFRKRKEELNEFLGKHEGIKHEFQVKLISPQDIAVLISAFANKEGGRIIFGVERDDTTLCGIESISPAIKYMDAALRYFGGRKPQVEYGWGLIDRSGKTFFIINVSPTDSEELFRADGKAYVRKGADNDLVDEYDRAKSSYELATLSRERLIENFRSIKSIIDDILDYHTNHKRKKNSKHERETFFILCSKFICDSFLAYLTDIWKEVSYKDTPPDKLHLYEHAKKDIDHCMIELKNGNTKSFLEGIASTTVIHTIIVEHLNTLNKLLDKPGSEITHKEIFKSITQLSKIAKEIDFAANEKYKLTQNRVRV